MTARALVYGLIREVEADIAASHPKLWPEAVRGHQWLYRIYRWVRDDAPLWQCGNCGAEYAGERCPCGHWPAKEPNA